MARARILKPGFFKNDVLAECSSLSRLLFAGLWTIADKEGRLEDRVKKIKVEILPYDDCDIDQLLEELVCKGFIVRYLNEENKYIQIVNFTKHQNPHKNEIESVIPKHEPLQKKREHSRKPRKHSGLNLNPDTYTLNPETPIPPEGAFGVPNPFAVWYEKYPHKIGRAAAEKAFWKAIKLADLDELLAGIERYKKSKPPDRPWCNPSTWLNQQRWKDEPNENTSNSYSGNSGKTKSERADDAAAEVLRELAAKNRADHSNGSAELRYLSDLREGPGSPEKHDEDVQRGLVRV